MPQMTIFIARERSKSDSKKSAEEEVKGPSRAVTEENMVKSRSPEVGEDPKVRQIPNVEAEISDLFVRYESLNETILPRSGATTMTTENPKAIQKKDGDNLSKMESFLVKSNGPQRQKTSSDSLRIQAANGVSDPRWFNEKKDSQSDLLNSSKWLVSADGSSLRNHPSQTLASSESDIFSTRNSGNPGDLSGRQHPLLKSSSGSQIHPKAKWNSGQSSRQSKFGAFTGVKPPSSISLLPPYVPPSIGRNSCCCMGKCCQRTNRTESSLSLTDEAETPEGLSWRRLHMSRAKLKATATTSELLSGFAMVAMVELQINSPTEVPEWLFVLFAVCTTILVSVHIFALMISTYLLPNIDAVSKLHVASLVTESPHDRMKSFIELAWAFSTILGLFLFLVEIAILCWVKFWDYSFMAAISATMIVIPVLILFVAFAIHFYHSLVVIKCKSSVSNMQELENIKRHLDNVSPA